MTGVTREGFAAVSAVAGRRQVVLSAGLAAVTGSAGDGARLIMSGGVGLDLRELF